MVIRYFASKYKDFYTSFRDSGLLVFIPKALGDLLSPQYNGTVNDVAGFDPWSCPFKGEPGWNEGDCAITNSQYISDDLVDVALKFYQETRFDPNELSAFKKMIGRFFYDEETGEYMHPISQAANPLARILREFQGDYRAMLEHSIYGFQEGNFFSYLFRTVKPDPQYTGFDVLKDINTLLDMKVMREYNHPETFWWHLSELMYSFAETAYWQHGMSWDPELNRKFYRDYYQGFYDIFH